MEERINEKLRKEKNPLPAPPVKGGDLGYRELHKEYKSSWIKRQKFSWGDISVERRYSKLTEWVHIEPTENQPNSILIAARRINQGAGGQRYHAAMYVNRRVQIHLTGIRQAMPYMAWLNICIDFAITTRRDYAPQLYQLRYMVENFPEWKVGGMPMPAFDEKGDYIK